MSSKNLVICDWETDYASGLAAFLNGKRELAFQVKICSSPMQVEQFRERESIDVLLVSEKWKDEKEIRGAGQTVFLVSGGRSEEEETQAIFKYQSGEEIYTKLIQICAEGNHDNILKIRRRKKGKILGFYSPIRRAGQTKMAMKKGQELSEKENVLYLNLELFAGIGGYFPEEEKNNLSVLLYYAKQETKNIGVVLTTLIRQIKGMDYIPPVLCPEDITSVSPEEWLWLFEEILESSLYDALILDLGEGIQGLYQILRICDAVYMATADDQTAASKLRQFEETLIRTGYQDVLERVVRYDNRRAAARAYTGAARPFKRN